jgi:hypothetical protein
MSRGVGDFALSGFIVTVERCRVLPKNDASRDVIVKCAQVLSERRGGGGTGFWHRFPQNLPEKVPEKVIAPESSGAFFFPP